MPLEEHYTVKEVARALRVTPTFIYRAVANGQLKPSYLPPNDPRTLDLAKKGHEPRGRLRFSESAVRAYMARQGQHS